MATEIQDVLTARGPVRLMGKVVVSGSKTAALAELAATLLSDSPVYLDNLPRVSDAATMCCLLTQCGAQVDRDHDSATISSRPVGHLVLDERASAIRHSILLAGPLLARGTTVSLSFPGGCSLGNRPIDYHLAALAAMGAEISIDSEKITFRTHGRMMARRIVLPYPSVGATANILMAASLARGTSVIENASIEPEVQDLVALLNDMGALIEDQGERVFTVRGRDGLGGARHRVHGDRIEAGTFMLAAILTGGQVALSDCPWDTMSETIHVFRSLGAKIVIASEEIVVTAPTQIAPCSVTTDTYPGFPTDLQPVLAVVLSQAHGVSEIIETVFESRFQYVEQLRLLGVEAAVDGRTLTITGPAPLHSAHVTATDIRGGASLLLGAMAAFGETTITNAGQIDRGYPDIELKLAMLGAHVTRES